MPADPESRFGAGRRRHDPGGRGTATLPELRRLVEDQFLTGFSHRLWVTGQVDAPETGPDGSLHFELVAVDDDEWLRLPCEIPAEALPELRSLLHRVSDADLDDVVAPGRAARVGGLLRYDFPTHRLALAVSAVDPAITAEALAEARARAREQVRLSDLPRHQRRLVPPVAPVHVAVVGGEGDPALLRAAERLRASGYAVRPRVVAAPLAGGGASGRVAEALAQVAGHCELVLLVRGEGRQLELAAFDGEDLARAVAATPVPVVAGLGGGGERTVSDEVVSESLPTADAAVDAVLARLAAAEDALRRWRGLVREEAQAALDRARARLEAERDAVEAVAERAAVRAEEAARRRWRALLAVAGVAAAVVVAVALATGTPAVLLLLAVVAALLGAERWRTSGADRRGITTVHEETSFAQVLERLERIRDELARSSNPDQVRGLHDEARRLVARGEQVLGRGLDGGPVVVASRPAAPATEAAATTEPAPVPAAAPAPAPAPESGGETTSLVVRPGGDPPRGSSPVGDSETTQVLPTRRQG